MPLLRVQYPLPFFEASAIVVPSDAPDVVKRNARAFKTYYGDLVQLCDGTADDEKINAALDEMTTGSVKCLAGTYNTAGLITVANNKGLEFEYGAIVKPSANYAVAFSLAKQSHMPHLVWDSTGLGDGVWTGAVVKLVADSEWYWDVYGTLHGWRFNNWEPGWTTPTGKAIWLHCDTKNLMVGFAKLYDMHIEGFEWAFYLQAEADPTMVGGDTQPYVNANQIWGCYVNECKYVVGIDAESGAGWGAVDGNIFSGIAVQVTSRTQAIVKHISHGHDNVGDFILSDIHLLGGSYIIEFANNCGGNKYTVDEEVIQAGLIDWAAGTFNNTVTQRAGYAHGSGVWEQKKVKRYWHRVEKLYDSDLFSNAGLIDECAIFSLPAKSRLLMAKIAKEVYFAAPGLTDLRVEIGKAGDHDGLIEGDVNLTTATYYVICNTLGAYWDEASGRNGTYYSAAGEDYIAYATATGANLDTLTQGELIFWFLIEVDET